MKLSKTPLSIRKERELNDLKKQLKKIKTQLKRSTTRLSNLQKGITKLQQNVANEMLQSQEKMKAVREELLALLKKIMASKKVDKESRAQAKEFFKELEDIDDTVPNMEDFEEGEDGEYEGRGGRFAFFEQFRAETPKEEQRSIRKVFIKLAARFHPDKASSTKEAEFFHKIMQKINTAYERNDILTLLELETQYADYKKEEVSNEIDESAIVSILDQEIAKAANELSLLEGQLNRIKAETKDLRASESGEMHREATRVKKYGVDFVASMREQMENAVAQLTAVKGVMEELLKKGTLTNEMLIKAGLMPDVSMFFDDYEDDDDDDDDDDFFGDMDGKDLQKMFKDMFGL